MSAHNHLLLSAMSRFCDMLGAVKADWTTETILDAYCGYGGFFFTAVFYVFNEVYDVCDCLYNPYFP